MSQVAEIFANYGLSPKVYLRDTVKENFMRLLCEYIDSGIPVVIGLEPGHAVVAIGHILDLVTDPMEPGYKWSSSYVSGLIVNDDNYMPYQVLHRVAPTSEDLRKGYAFSQIDSFVVPLHDKVHLVAEDVEKLTYRILQDPEYGLDTLSPFLSEHQKNGTLLIRQYLTTSRAYREERCSPESKPPHGLDRFYSTHSMPRFIWVSELSTQSLYTEHQHILGEILWDATACQGDWLAFLLVHYPEVFFVNDRDSFLEDKNRLVPIALPSVHPYPAYRHNLKEVYVVPTD